MYGTNRSVLNYGKRRLHSLSITIKIQTYVYANNKRNFINTFNIFTIQTMYFNGNEIYIHIELI